MHDFAQQLARCAQSHEEAVAFMEAFARVRLAGITKALSAPMREAIEAEDEISPDWQNVQLLSESGIDPAELAVTNHPEKIFLHIDVAASRAKAIISVFLDMTGLSDKQRSDLYPWLSTQKGDVDRDTLSGEVRRLNRHLAWVRTTGVQPETFLAYHRHLGIHGSSQNFSGQVGAMGAAICFIDALNEISPGCVVEVVGTSPSELLDRSPEAIAGYLTNGTKKDVAARQIRALVLANGRFVVFSSDPDVSIFTPLIQLPTSVTIQAKGKARARVVRFDSAGFAALYLYNQVRQHADQRRQKLHEFAVGEVKTATDPSNLHERLALGSRETKVEVNADRFLLMALLTRDILEGGTGKKSSRAPLQNRDTVRFTDVFNLHHAWGWDGGRLRHPDHWNTFKERVKTWTGL
jgi:hypothetical protein